MAKHYIRCDESNRGIKAFSDAFEQPLETDFCITEEGGRHFNPTLFNERGIPLTCVSENKWVERTEEEIQADVDALPEPPLTEMQKMDADIQANYRLMLAALEVW